MEKSEAEEIKMLIDKRIKVVIDGISMLHEEITSIKKSIDWTLYILLGAVLIIGLIGLN